MKRPQFAITSSTTTYRKLGPSWNLRLVRQGWTTPEIEFIKGVTVPHGSKILFLNKRIVYGRGIFWNDYWDPLLMEASMFARK